jgi:hypothetical protein
VGQQGATFFFLHIPPKRGAITNQHAIDTFGIIEFWMRIY